MDFRKTLNGLLLLAALGLPATGVRAAWEGDWSVPRGCNQPITQLERLDANRAILLGSFDVCGTAAAPGMAVYDFSGNRFRAVGVDLSATVDVLPDLRALAARSDGAGKVYLAGIDADSRLRLARVGSSNGLEWIVSSGGPELAGEPVAMDFDSAGQLYLATEQGVLRGSPGSPWSWTRLGALDLFPSTGRLLALAYDRERSQVVVGGNFQSIGGTAASHIAHWNGSSWQPLNAPLDGIGLDGPVNTLVSLPDGNAGLSSGLYVGGQFTGGVAGVLELHNIARYNGFGYNALGASLSTRGLRNGAVLAIRPNQARTRLLIAGAFQTAGTSQTVNGVVQWDGASWFALDDVAAGLGLDPRPAAIVEVDGRIVVGGSIYSSGTLALSHVAHYQANGWRTLGGSTGLGLVGRAGLLGLRAANPARLPADDALFIGELDRLGLQDSVNAVRWDAATSTPRPVVPSGSNVPLFARGCADRALPRMHLFAPGSDPFAGAGVSGPHAQLAVASMQLQQGSSQSADRCVVAAGTGVVYSSRYNSGTAMSEIRAYNPSSGVGTVIGQASGSVGVMAFDDLRGVLYVGGTLFAVNGVSAANVARYTVATDSWANLGADGVNGSVNAIGIDPQRSDYVYVGGQFSQAGGMAQPAVARWHTVDQMWVPMADFCGAIDGACAVSTLQIRSLLPVGSDAVFVGGQFASLDGGRGLLSYSSGSWSDVFDGGVFGADGQAGAVQQLHRAGDRLVVAGQFVGTGRGAASRAASGLAVFALPADPVVDAIFADGYE